MNEQNIHGSFRGSELVQFNPDSVICRPDVKLQYANTAGHFAERGTAKATSQTGYVKRRYANHQNSLPTVHLPSYRRG